MHGYLHDMPILHHMYTWLCRPNSSLLFPNPFAPQVCPSNLVRLYSAPSANPDTLVVCGSAGPLCSLVNVRRGHDRKGTGWWEEFIMLSIHVIKQ